MNTLFIDIETIPAQRADVMEEIRTSKRAELDAALASIAPPGNYKKAETIAEWMANEAPKIAAGLQAGFDADVDDAYRKTGLDGSFGQVCVIGFALNDDAPRAIVAGGIELDDEREILDLFAGTLSNLIKPSDAFTTCVVGHNVTGFDLRFLAQRSIVHGVRPHVVIARAAQAKPWESDKVFDTMVQWGGLKPGGSLDKLCRALSIPTPKGGDITGATVWDAVKAGRLAEVAEYCKRDVEATRAVFRRMTYQTVQVFEDVDA
jgi:predicted PolB exonuclease-like 3'-5' exonuclease